MGPAALAQVLRSMTLTTNPNLLVGLSTSDDAAVYRLSDDTALVQTVDFFPPIVDDPYTFGAIAAANSLSDVYAMGGRPILALAVAGFPDSFSPELIATILQGGIDKVTEAGAVVAGGHTVVDQEPKYGLCVTGLVHPERVLTKANARPRDVLLLTKPLGTGVITTAHKRSLVSDEHFQIAVNSMLRLNRRAAEAATEAYAHAATDITGYGLLGHAYEMAEHSGVALQITLSAVPLLPGTLEYAQRGIVPGGLGRNRAYLEEEHAVAVATDVDPTLLLPLFDPQTSGGLLLALPPDAADRVQAQLSAAGEPCWRIGSVEAGRGIRITE